MRFSVVPVALALWCAEACADRPTAPVALATSTSFTLSLTGAEGFVGSGEALVLPLRKNGYREASAIGEVQADVTPIALGISTDSISFEIGLLGSIGPRQYSVRVNGPSRPIGAEFYVTVRRRERDGSTRFYAADQGTLRLTSINPLRGTLDARATTVALWPGPTGSAGQASLVPCLLSVKIDFGQ